MSDTSENKNTPSQKPKKSKLSIVFRIIFVFIFVLILLIVGIILFIQTDTFDRIALNIALDKLNESFAEKNSVIYAESLEGNLLKGFVLKNGSIKVKNDTLLKFSEIEAKYNVWALLDKEIVVDRLILRDPQINLTKIKDRNDSLKWNFAYFLESEKKEEDTTKSEFDWGIIAGDVSIENGSIRILEEKNTDIPIREIIMPKLDSMDFGKLDVTNMNLNLSARYFPDMKSVDIKNLSANTNSDFNLKKLSFAASLDEKKEITGIKKLFLQTSRTNVEISRLEVNEFNPLKGFSYDSLGSKRIELDMKADKFDFKDLCFFLPEINFLDSTVSVTLSANGEYGNLNIDTLIASTPNSRYSFEGNVKNLHKPSELYFNVTGNDIEIDPRDAKLNLPGINIPDYSYLGNVRIPYVTYKGEPAKFSSDFDVRTSAGNAMGNVYFDFTKNISEYKGDVSVSELNIGKVVKDKDLESSINGNFKVDAKGFDYRTMSGRMNYSIHSTRFYGQNISKSDGQLNFNRGNVGLDVAYNSSSLTTKVAGKINISNLNNISYDLKGSVSGLNVAAFTKDNSQTSNLSFNFAVNGRGYDPENISGTYKIDMNASSYAGYNIPATPIDAEIDQDGNIKKLTLKSDLVDVKTEGSFNMNSLMNSFTNNIDKVSSELLAKFFPDSAKAIPVGDFTVSCNNLNMKYEIDIKDLAPLYSFTGNDTLKIKSHLTGSISDSCGKFRLFADGVFHEVNLNDSLFVTDTAFLKAEVVNDIASNDLTGFNADIDFFSKKFIMKGKEFDSTDANIKFAEGKNQIVLFTKKDSTIRAYTQAAIEDSAVIRIDSVSFRYTDYLLTNNKAIIIKPTLIDSNLTLDFRQFAVNSLDQKLLVEGTYSTGDTSNIRVSASNIDLGIYQRMYLDNEDTASILNGKVRYLDVNYSGTFQDPQMELMMTTEILRVGKTKIGRLDAMVKYSNDEIVPNIVFTNEKSTGKFSLTGLVPYANPFIGLDSIARQKRVEGKIVSLDAVADNFQLKVFQQMLPYTSNLSGVLDGKISFHGTSDKPDLTGSMNVKKGQVTVTLTKMIYDFEAKLSTKDEKLLIESSKLFVTDDPNRFISAAGYIDFTDLTLKDINLVMKGDVKAFDRDNGMTELGIFGDLWVGSGRNSLRLRGNASRLDFTGNLVLVKGNVVFNPFIQEAYNIYTDDISYGILIDSLKEDGRYKKLLRQGDDSVIVLTGLNLNPFDKILYTSSKENVRKEAKEKSGKFFYNVIVTTSGNVFLKFIVNEKTQQEFFGEIRTEDLNIYNDENNKMMGRGTITLGESYYKFFRKFDASGKINFVGPITNPRLEILATYKGYSTTSSQGGIRQSVVDVEIDMKVTGNAENPNLAISLNKGGQVESGSDATADAISFLLFGQFKDQLSFSESSSFGATLGANFLSNYFSSSIEQVFPWLINTEVNYIDSKSGSFAENTDIRFTASVGDAVIRFGGQIFRGIANTDIVVDYPLNRVFGMEKASSNLMVRIERVYDPFINQNSISNTDGSRAGAVLYYRIRF